MGLKYALSAPVAFEIDTTPSLVLLVHADGTDASTAFVDNGANTMTFSPTGATQMDTAQKVFGTASALFDGSGRLGVLGPAGQLHPVQYDLGPSPDSLLDMWVRPSAHPPVNPEFLFGYEQNAPNWWRLAITATGRIIYEVTVGFAQAVLLTTTTVAALNTWTHVIVARHAGVTTLGIGVQGSLTGALEASGPDTTNYSLSAGGSLGNAVIGGAAVAGDPFHGWIDEIRYKSGAYLSATSGRYTLPTAAYSPP